MNELIMSLFIEQPGYTGSANYFEIALVFQKWWHKAVSGPNEAYMEKILKELKLVNLWFNVDILAKEYQRNGFEAVVIL